ncbi:MAG: 5-(carboxyamino)imidazole ribonucleotide synthase [Pseudomonadota bacterium]
MALKHGDTIGIIGGGQLGRMLAIAAARLGFNTVVLDPQENAPAFQCANERIVAAYDDNEALDDLAQRSDAVTYEFENVNVAAIRNLESSLPCHPNAKALSTSQDRLIEKQFFNDLGIETAPFFDITSMKDFNQALSKLNNRGILKTRRMGYDGKGQVRVSLEDPNGLKVARELVSSFPCILEGYIEFVSEISIIAARGTNGTVKAFELGENVHRDGILHTTTIPAEISDATTKDAHAIAAKVLGALDYVGVIGIEFFVMDDGGLIANEYAPRVHNSGHWTEAACTVSQFEQHIRAIAGLELGDPANHSNCIMQNLIGDEVQMSDEILARPNTLLHLYGKSESRPGRKMGHFTTIAKK